MSKKKAIQQLNAIQEHITNLQSEYKILQELHQSLKNDYDKLYNLVLTVLDACDEKTLILHRSHFMRLAAEMRIDQSYDEKTGEFTFKLRTLRD